MAFLPVMEWLGNIEEEVTHLVIHDWDTSKEILKWLAERVESENEITWRCSWLRTLELRGLVELDDLRDFGDMRYAKSTDDGGVTKEGNLDVYWPALLETLDISGFWEPSDDEDEDRISADEEIYEWTGCKRITGYNRKRRRRDDYDYY
ncbi:hypothetical protein FRB90_001830 [Tulasnella sp. 427]|nr:hypothetical protein FRB90_001830 [Tulasnella sp. 427]